MGPPAADQGVTTRGDDDRSQGRTEPPGREIGQRAPGGGHVPAAVRRGLHIVGGRVVVEAEVDLGNVARRLRKDIFELYGYTAVVHVLSASGIRKSTRYVLRVANDGEALARQTGLLDNRGRPVRGLPAQVVGGSVGDAEAAWRGPSWRTGR